MDGLHTGSLWCTGKSRKIKSDVMVGNMMWYIEDESLETAKLQIDIFGLPMGNDSTDNRMLKYAWLYWSQKMRRRWDGFIATLPEIEGPQHTPPEGALLVQQIQAYHDTCDMIDVHHTDIECIIAPSIVGQKALDFCRKYRTEEAFAAQRGSSLSYARHIS